jgi:hypothetical protein
MAHFAKIDSNNVVEQVTVVANENIQNTDFPASEAIGKEYIASIGLEGNWVQTSYNSNFRKRYAGIGYTYNAELDAFVPPKPYPSWTFDNELANWIPPVEMPTDSLFYEWDESTTRWIKY